MATDVDVQYFSHLNGLVLGNNWGDLIRLLDKALVTGIDFTQITAASIDEQGDVSITLFAAHDAMLFQVVELSGFTPNSLNQKYRIKGVPNTTQLILKPALDITERSITTMGTGKLASLGYDIIFRDTNDVKRVYRAKNPRSEHPFIRVDESLTSADGTTGVYTSTYAKFAMVGLLEHMDHIDDYQNPNVLQLPFDPSNPAKNWKIAGTGTAVVRGWSRWYWAQPSGFESDAQISDSQVAAVGNRAFTLCGSSDAFYLLSSTSTSIQGNKRVYGCGIHNSALDSSVIPPWFLISNIWGSKASDTFYSDYGDGTTPLMQTELMSKFYTPRYNLTTRLSTHVFSTPLLPSYKSGFANDYSNLLGALEIPFYDQEKFLRGTLKHIHFACNAVPSKTVTTPSMANASMYVSDTAYTKNGSVKVVGGFYFYLGELE
ncbi:hypothetical protein ACNFX6_09190 [Acinetobacter johnsonii]|uniref:hypothetical protein n=1 Tax=Acinetobacter johnsonii TaxID=40214 RepID=UPI003CF2F304